MAQPLPWVKSHTRVLTSMRWLALPIEERGVFDHLTRLGGVGSKRGFVEGTDEQIASLIHCPAELVTRTVEHLAAKPYESLRRHRKGVLIVNWNQYQAPANYDPDLSYGRKPTVRSAESTPLVRGRVEGEIEREGEAPRTLASVQGYPYEPETDALFLAKLHNDFPGVDLAGEARKWAIYKLDKPLTARSSPRSQFRTWVENSVLFAVRDGKHRVVPGPAPDIETQLAEQNRRRGLA